MFPRRRSKCAKSARSIRMNKFMRKLAEDSWPRVRIFLLLSVLFCETARRIEDGAPAVLRAVRSHIKLRTWHGSGKCSLIMGPCMQLVQPLGICRKIWECIDHRSSVREWKAPAKSRQQVRLLHLWQHYSRPRSAKMYKVRKSAVHTVHTHTSNVNALQSTTFWLIVLIVSHRFSLFLIVPLPFGTPVPNMFLFMQGIGKWKSNRQTQSDGLTSKISSKIIITIQTFQW